MTPYYIADTHMFVSNCQRLENEVLSYYNKYSLAYSFKTSYFRGFLEAALQEGLFAEVVSPKEYLLAKKIGFSDERIIWNGVLPSDELKINCISNGGIVNVDNLHELESLIQKWKFRYSHPMPIGIRFEIRSLTNSNSRFGIPDNKLDLIQRYVLEGSIKVVSTHCHISRARSLLDFHERVERMAFIAKALGATILDIGGNMYGSMHPEFSKQYKEPIPTLEEYGQMIGSDMKRLFPEENVHLVTENGTALTCNAVDLVASVIKKETRKGRVCITLDCKHTDVGFACYTKNPAIESLAVSHKQSEDFNDAVIYGCTCIEEDIIHRSYSGNLEVGDLVKIKNIGAYSANITNDFISDRPIFI